MTEPQAASAIRIAGVSKYFRRAKGAEPLAALLDVSLDIEPGSFTCLVGPSGCGKSTLLSLIGGFARPDQGRVEVNGTPVSEPGADRGMIFQEPTLFSWLTVHDNVLFGPRAQGKLSPDIEASSTELLDIVGLAQFRDHYPHQLSGGMKQRLAIARALINRPGVLLMDEPFGALDAITRGTMQRFLLDLWTTHRTTIVFVTHDVEEAVLLADKVVVMSPRPGRIAASIDIDLPQPRSTSSVDEPEQVAIRRQVRGHLAQVLDHA
ncbi:MAG TPA: ABC transporter ATP-binding protein [Stellaceae bacterium]|nr:ABC transporter ATP-binding protein [Stellaceae bacterium]